MDRGVEASVEKVTPLKEKEAKDEKTIDLQDEV